MASISAADSSSAMKESPNWVEMPEEVMVDIFNILTTLEILNSPRKVCTTWRRICKSPALWKVIDMLKRPFNHWYPARSLKKMAKQPVDLSCGELTDISIGGFGSDDLLDHIVLCSNKLKHLCLLSCIRITGSRLSLAVKKVPQLEKLDLYNICIKAEDIEVIGRNCPQLKSLRLRNVFLEDIERDSYALAIAYNMPELRHLQLFDKRMTNYGLLAILNGCPYLKSLDVRMCSNPDHLAEDIEKLCMQRGKPGLKVTWMMTFLKMSSMKTGFNNGDMCEGFYAQYYN